jgi:hypothetical protein
VFQCYALVHNLHNQPVYLAAQPAAPLPKGKKKKTVGDGEQQPNVCSISNAHIKWTHPCVSGII